jgi:hypothetical protein
LTLVTPTARKGGEVPAPWPSEIVTGIRWVQLPFAARPSAPPMGESVFPRAGHSQGILRGSELRWQIAVDLEATQVSTNGRCK